jgi:hypothetical protein
MKPGPAIDWVIAPSAFNCNLACSWPRNPMIDQLGYIPWLQ